MKETIITFICLIVGFLAGYVYGFIEDLRRK